MANLPASAAEVYTIMRSFDYGIDLWDDKSNKVYEPEEARWFFGTKTMNKKKQTLMVEISELNTGCTLRLHTGPSSNAVAFTGFWETLKTSATKYVLTPNLQTHDQEIHPKNFAMKAMNEGISMIDLTENQDYGTTRSSYFPLGEAKVIARHKCSIDPTVPGARRRNIKHVFVENSQGERHLMPNNNLAAGLAMGQHVNQGNHWSDNVAAQINNMATDYAGMGDAAGYLGGTGAMCEGAEDLREKALATRKAIRETFKRMRREDSYAAESSRLANMGETPLLEGEVLERLREQLTVEGRKLPESVVNACSRLMAEGDCVDESILGEEAPEIPGEKGDGKTAKAITLMGHTISRHVFDLFNNEGKLEMSKGTPDLSRMPPFQKVTDELMYKLSEVAKYVDDDAMANFLTAISNQWEQGKFGKNPSRDNILIRMAALALKAAGVASPISKTTMSESLGLRGCKSVLEMEQWFAGFDPDRVLLAETDCKRDAEDCEDDAEKVTDCDDALDDCNDEVRELKKKLKKVDEGKDDDDEDEDENTCGQCEGTGSTSDMGYKEECPVCDGSGVLSESVNEDLTQEDILLPKDQGLDLASEVVARGDDDEDMNRMLTLAGRPIQQTPVMSEHTNDFEIEPSDDEKFNIKQKGPGGKIVGMGYADRKAAENSAEFKQGRLNK